MSEDLIVCNNNLCVSVGSILYDIIPSETLWMIGNEAEQILRKCPKDDDDDDEDTGPSYEILIENNQLILECNSGDRFPLKSKIIEQLIQWISQINGSQQQVVSITYNWITWNGVNVETAETCYILTLYSDDWVGTYLSISYGDWKTRKYTRSKSLYPDEREEHQHYYDGGCLIINPANGISRQMSASNCLIFHLR